MSSPPITPEQLAALPPEFQAILRAVVEHYERRIAELEAEIARLKKTPRNSSLPPSSEHPHAKPPPDKPKSKKNRGGQPGHEKHERALIPAEQCTEVIAHKPHACRRCGCKLAGSDPQPLRHQVWELPEIKPLVTEHQLHRLTCRCGATTCAALPPGVPRSTAGPRLIALTALLMGCFRQSKRRVATNHDNLPILSDPMVGSTGLTLCAGSGSDNLQFDVDSFAGGHAATVRVAPHQAAAQVAIGNKEQSGRQFVTFGGDHLDLYISELARQADAVPFLQPKLLHVSRGDLQRLRLLEIRLLELPFANADALLARAAGNEDERMWHRVTDQSGSESWAPVRRSLDSTVVAAFVAVEGRQAILLERIVATQTSAKARDASFAVAICPSAVHPRAT
jgi:hypothetical protein